MSPLVEPRAGSGDQAIPAASHAPFSSALSVPEFALLDAAQVTPLAPVMGCEIRWLTVTLPIPASRPARKAGSPFQGGRYDGDVTSVESLDAEVRQARHLAFDHLRQEATALGADAVVGVRHVRAPIAPAKASSALGRLAASAGGAPCVTRSVEYQLIGTAVRDPANRCTEPQVSTLTAADFCKLRLAGWQPAGVVGGCSHQIGRNIWAGSVAREVEGATAIWTTARTQALTRVRAELTEIAADGVIGLDMQTDHQVLELSQRGSTVKGGHAVLESVTVIATAIRRAAGPIVSTPNPTRILTLR